MGKVDSRMVYSSLHSLTGISTLGSTRGGSVGTFMCQSVSALYHLGKFTTFGSLGVECFQTSLDISDDLCISSPYIISPSSVHVSGKICHSQFRLPILVAPCWMEVSRISIVLNMLVGMPYRCPIIKDIRDV